MIELFANTGVQVVFFRVPRSGPEAQAVGRGWQSGRVQRGTTVKDLPWLQWRFEEGPPRLFFAVDTTLGPENSGYLADPTTFAEEQREFDLSGLLDATGARPLDLGGAIGPEGRPLPLAFAVRPKGDGEPREVHLAVDFGNNRTGALLLEISGAKPNMMPLELVNRLWLDAWDERGALVPRPRSRWFTSQTHWCAAPYREPAQQKYEVVVPVERKGLFGTKTEHVKEERRVRPALFLDHSLVRMGQEGADVVSMIWGEDRPITGVSSPKRYLWADDSDWLEKSNWHMADPFDRHSSGLKHMGVLQGGLLKFVSHDDDDRLLGADWDKSKESPTNPTSPQFPPRSLMMAALYEIVCQGYALINSVSYRRRMGDARRLRRLASLSLSYPSGMIAPERKRLELQAKKACRAFDLTTGRSQTRPVSARLSVDEASAVHLTYIWSELQLLDFRPDFWFEVAGRRRVGPDGKSAGAPEVRIACVDVGGGTTDLMIAKYSYEVKLGGRKVIGEVLHRDGVSLAGDHLIKRMLEQIVVPEFGRAVGLDGHQLNFLFGPEQVANRGLRVHRVDWVNRLFVPLAVAYLERAVVNSNEPISHTNSDLVSPEVLDSLQRVVNEKFKIGQAADVKVEMDLRYDAARLDDLINRVFQDLLFDLCSRIVEHDADVVLLAGQPTKLQSIQKLIQSFLPLTASRIVPMHNYYAGNEYPYQDEEGRDPGRIVDPKSAVVVGTAIHHMARTGKLTQFVFEMRDPVRTESYHWGLVNPQTYKIDEFSVVFPADPDHKGKKLVEFQVTSEDLLLGRRLSPSAKAQPSPVYQLRCREDDQGEDQRIDVVVRLERFVDPEHKEELLRLVEAKGTVHGRPAEKDKNVQLKMLTLAHERYYLDLGALDNIAAP